MINYAGLGLNASNPAIQRPSWSLESRCHNPECQLPGAVGFVNGYRQRSQKMLCDGGEKNTERFSCKLFAIPRPHQTTDGFAFNASHCGSLAAHRSLTLTILHQFQPNSASVGPSSWMFISILRLTSITSRASHQVISQATAFRFVSASLPKNTVSIVL